ncbi:hypothetical protein K469DRAFT_670767 [Zopfia rhizophila CBS 207.26]|uniref:Ubiquitin interaction motif protein n=1 Tax=Zopfia rhizophila CBS 207.26 TaxID=1314779 RepID=A0A6A6DQ86_9PEZI|nr:hypothetical protein K469DRAFT_670767 [Zopfia rhizophila CBS 207.26]
MSAEALENSAAMFGEMVGGELTREDCLKFLRTCNNDLNLALNKYYDQGLSAIQENAWDSSLFSADRYGQHEESNAPSFRIDFAPGLDNYPHSGAPSRPPSRTSHRSGSSPAHIGDAPVQSVENGQESGVIGNSGPVFGPATREFYESNQWALVPTTTTAEYIPDAIPTQRRREEEGPAIIKPLPNGDYLPALITILHSVPLFRNMFLAPELSLDDYGVNEDWWKGTAFTPARTVEYGSKASAAHELDLIHETQRLMAFLDSSDRAYGSVGCLLQLEAFAKASELVSEFPDFHKFLMVWGGAYQNQTSHAQLNGVLRSMVNANGKNVESWFLDAAVIHHDPSASLTIYDVLDAHLLSTPSGKAHIVDISNVLVMQLTGSNNNATSLDVKIPSTFFADRYLMRNKQAIDEMLQEMKQYEDQIAQIDAKASKLKYHQDRKTGQKMDSLKLLKTSMSAFIPKEGDLIENPRNAEILIQLQSIHDSVERKLSKLEEEKKKVRETLDSISNLFKGPIDDGTDSSIDITENSNTSSQVPTRRSLSSPYKLCGVSTRPNVFYLLHPDIKSDVPNAKQWWRVEYATGTSEAYILRERLTLARVLEKASSEHDSVLLVYANDAALSTPPIQLAKPLQDFIKKDNLMFLREIQNDFEGKPNVPVIGDWDREEEDPPDYGEDWAYNGGSSVFGGSFETVSAKQFHQNQGDSGFSSTTLTPNTEIEDEAVDVADGMEMTEISGGMATWAGGVSNASSDTVGGEVMEIVDSQRIDLKDGIKREADESPEVRHIEFVEPKKGG